MLKFFLFGFTLHVGETTPNVGESTLDVGELTRRRNDQFPILIADAVVPSCFNNSYI